MRSKLLAILFMLLFPYLTKGQKSGLDIPLFTIDDRGVKVDEFIYLYNKNHQGKENEFTKEKIEEYLCSGKSCSYLLT